MDRDLEERLSVNVCLALDSLGYSYVSIKNRQSLWQEMDMNWNHPVATLIHAGSKAEGVSLFLESDHDAMLSLHDLLCTDNVDSVDTDRYKAVFQLITDNVSPGYARLRHADFRKVQRMAHRDRVLGTVHNWSFQHEDGEYYIGSDFVYPPGINRAGPAGNMIHHGNLHNVPQSFSIDRVVAIPCQSERLLQAWVNRPRHQGWPPREVIHQISCIEGHVVPVGFKGSRIQYMEWRICFTKAELLLVKHFNATHLHLFVLMKKVNKLLIQPVCPDITSYVIKNVIFWMAEYLPRDRFTNRNLLSLALYAVKLLHGAVTRKLLPNYMIPTRNLFDGKLQQQERHNVCQQLSSLIRQGPISILQRPEMSGLRRRVLLVYREPVVGLYIQINSEMWENTLVMKRRGQNPDFPLWMIQLYRLRDCLHIHPDVLNLLQDRILLYLNRPSH